MRARVSVRGCFQEFHYRPRASDTCLPCDCYPVGSFSRSCDPESGQCQCRPGVIGRQCNSCDNPFAEVTNSGCEGRTSAMLGFRKRRGKKRKVRSDAGCLRSFCSLLRSTTLCQNLEIAANLPTAASFSHFPNQPTNQHCFLLVVAARTLIASTAKRRCKSCLRPWSSSKLSF